MQINFPFSNTTKKEDSGCYIEFEKCGEFMSQLYLVWKLEYFDEIRINPFNQIHDYFMNPFSKPQLKCVWGGSCSDTFLSIQEDGALSICDCLAYSGSEFNFGNILTCDEADLIDETRKTMFVDRMRVLIEGKCGVCDYFDLCHGGCPVRSYHYHKNLSHFDPYCESYKSLFSVAEMQANLLNDHSPEEHNEEKANT